MDLVRVESNLSLEDGYGIGGNLIGKFNCLKYCRFFIFAGVTDDDKSFSESQYNDLFDCLMSLAYS